MSKRILLVDNDAESRSRVSKLLQTEGYEIRSADDAETGLALVSSWQPHAIIFEVELPGMSGTIMYSQLRRNRETRDLPAMVLSAVGPRPVDFGTGIPVLPKGCDDVTLLNTVRHLLET